MVQKNKGLLIIVAVVAIFAGAFWFANQAAEEANEGVTISDNVKGNPDADVVLVKYSDFQCPACAAAATVVDTLLEEYGDDLRVEYRHFPLVTIHPLAIPAARATEAAAQQGAFWEMHDRLFENQQAWSTAANPTAFFIGYAEDIGLDVPTFRRHLDASVIEDHVREQFAEARDAGFTGTPTFTLNGERMQFDTYEAFATQIATAIAVASGGVIDTTDPATATGTPTTAADVGVQFGI
jgi:protein-disulfide isomerase